MPKLNGPTYEYYEADEDIAILAIEQKTRPAPNRQLLLELARVTLEALHSELSCRNS
jgi:hypothetical protein